MGKGDAFFVKSILLHCKGWGAILDPEREEPEHADL